MGGGDGCITVISPVGFYIYLFWWVLLLCYSLVGYRPLVRGCRGFFFSLTNSYYRRQTLICCHLVKIQTYHQKNNSRLHWTEYSILWFLLDPVIKLRVSTLLTSNEYLILMQKTEKCHWNLLLTDETIFMSCCMYLMWILSNISKIFCVIPKCISYMKCNLKGPYNEIFSTSHFQQLHDRYSSFAASFYDSGK